jgi:hypothetical protein
VHVGVGPPTDVDSSRRARLECGEKMRKSPITTSQLILKVATIRKNLDLQASKENPHLARNDIAIARLTRPLKLDKYNTLGWFTDEVPPGTAVILVGKDDVGLIHYAGKDKYKHHVGIQSLQRGLVSGNRYVFDVFHARSVEYHSAIIWRSNVRSVKGESGSCLVMLNGTRVEVIGTQSHEFTDSGGILLDPPQYLKIAYRAPYELINGYHAICQTDVLRRIRETGNQGA